MTEVQWAPDMLQAFRQDRGKGAPIGYLTRLSLGDISLTADLPVTVPGELPVVAAGVLSEIGWAGGPTDPLTVAGVISVANKHAVGNVSTQSLSSALVKLSFAVHAFDPRDKSYFKAFHTGEVDVKGRVRTRPAGAPGSPFELRFATQPAPEPQTPVVIPFSMTLVPASEEMDMHVATANLQVQVWSWGVAS